MKNFKSYQSLVDAEAYFIRINLPKLNEHIVHKNFTLFWSGRKNLALVCPQLLFLEKFQNSRLCNEDFLYLQVYY